MPSTSSRTLFLLACLLFTAAMVVYSGRIVGIDTEATFATSATLAEHGRWDMNINAAAIWMQHGIGVQGIVSPDGNVYTKKAPLVSLAHVPATWLGGRLPYMNPTQGALLTIPFVFALTGILMVRVAERFGLSSRLALVGAVWWAFGTFALANTTEMFAEPIMALGVLLAVYRLLGKERKRRDVLFAGIGCAIIILGNPASILVVLVIAIALYLPRGIPFGHSIIFALPIVIAGLLFGYFNMLRTGSFLMTGYGTAGAEGFTTPLWVGLSGMLVTPYRGILWYAPIAWLTLPGYWIVRRYYRASFMLILIIAQLLPYSLWWDWAGGLVWGPRFLLPILPLIVILALPTVERLWLRKWGKLTIFALAIVSLLLQIPGTLMHYSLYENYIRQTYPAETSHYIIGLQDRIVLLPQFSPIFGNLAYLLTEDWWVVWDTPQFWWVGLTIGVGLMGIIALWRFGKGKYAVPLAIGIALYSGIVAPYAATQLYTSANQPVLQAFFQNHVEAGDAAIVNANSASNFLDVPARPYIFNIREDAESSDTLAQSMLTNSLRFPRIWFFTHKPTANWLEAELWGGYYIGANQLLGDYRVVLVDTRRPSMPIQTIGVEFDSITLESIGITSVNNDVYVALQWAGAVPSGANMFIHLINADGNIIAQHDRLPLNDILPIASFTDKHVFPVPDGYVSGMLQLRIGWADKNGSFIATDTGDNYLLLMVN